MLPKILIIDHDLEAIAQIQRTLEAEGYEVLTTVTGQAGIALAQLQRPNLVLLDVDLPDINGYEVCRTLRATPATSKLPIVFYSARADVTDKVAGLKAGANDYIVKPAATAELVARIKAALRSEEQALAYIVALWGAKGGVGTTTIASNLALALRLRTGKRVTLVDASVLGGTLGVALNLAPQHTLVDLLPRLDDLDSELLDSVLLKHSSGVRVLLSVPWSKNGTHVQPQQFERILAWLQETNDYLVIDTAPSLDPTTLALLKLADQVVVVLSPEMASLRNARLFLEMAEAWRQTPDKFVLALSRYPIKGGLTLPDVERALQKRVEAHIPNDENLVTYSVNRGIPLVVSHARSAVGQSFYRLAETITATAGKKRRVSIRSTVLAQRF